MQTPGNILLSIVVPLFNEESNLKSLFARLKQAEARIAPTRLEIIFVDDCSQDNTSGLVKQICSTHENVRLIRFAKNSGSHAAIIAGIVASKGDCVMFMAGDLQDPPELIPEMLKSWSAGNYIVWAARTQTFGQERRDSLFASLYWWMVNQQTHNALPKSGVDFFLIDRQVVDAIAPQHNCKVPAFLMVAETGFKSAIVSYTKADRAGGKSGWTLKKKLALVLETALFSPMPLRAVSAGGAVISAAAILFGILSVILHLVLGQATDGLTLVACLVAFFAGVQLVVTGLVGEYLFLTLKEARYAPRYVIAEKVNFASDKTVDAADTPGSATFQTALSAR